YPALSRIIGEVAPRFGIDYRLLELEELLRLQQRFLSAMGRKPH
ncbi:acyl-CoA desaturase, partial [Serratia marcescens]